MRQRLIYKQPDPVAVERALRGGDGNTLVRLHPCEKLVVIGTLTDRGLSARGIAEQIGCSERQVNRYRRFIRAR